MHMRTGSVMGFASLWSDGSLLHPQGANGKRKPLFTAGGNDVNAWAGGGGSDQRPSPIWKQLKRSRLLDG